MRSLAAVALLFLSGAASASDLSVASQWKARALEAQKALSSYGEQAHDPNTDPRVLPFLAANALMEAAYAAHLDKELGPVVHRLEPDDGEMFHLLLNGGEGQGLFDLLYVYDGKGTLTGVRIDRIPKGWSVTMLAGAETVLLVSTKDQGLLFAIHTDKPFDAIGMPGTAPQQPRSAPAAPVRK